jgi:hypothetical protein
MKAGEWETLPSRRREKHSEKKIEKKVKRTLERKILFAG